MEFHDRPHAGRLLVSKLEHYRNKPEVIVLALPRGGVPVAFEVAKALKAPLDVFIVRKLGMPGHEEYAIGAIASGSVRVMNPEFPGKLVSTAAIEAVVAREQRELERRERLYRENRPPLSLAGRIVILVDDGLATGSTMGAATVAVQQQKPARCVVAVPVAAPEVYARFQMEVDEVVCTITPKDFHAVGQWYKDFRQTTDDEVEALLAMAQESTRSGIG